MNAITPRFTTRLSGREDVDDPLGQRVSANQEPANRQCRRSPAAVVQSSDRTAVVPTIRFRLQLPPCRSQKVPYQPGSLAPGIVVTRGHYGEGSWGDPRRWPTQALWRIATLALEPFDTGFSLMLKAPRLVALSPNNRARTHAFRAMTMKTSYSRAVE